MNINKLKILVVDDEENHRRAAELLLKDHAVTIVGSYDEARDALTSHTSYEQQKALLPGLLEVAGLDRDFSPYGKHVDASAEDKKKFTPPSEAAPPSAAKDNDGYVRECS